MDFFVQQLAEVRRRVFGSIWKYRMQWFSWRTCTFRAAGANVEYLRNELLGGARRHDPREIDKIGLSKMQFRAFLGRNWVTGIMRGTLFLFFDCVHYITK